MTVQRQPPGTAPARSASPAGPAEQVRAVQARSLAQAVGCFEFTVLGRTPTSVTVVDRGDCTMLSLLIPFSPMERRLNATPLGRQRVNAWHHSLAHATFEAFRDHVRDASGVSFTSLALALDVMAGCLVKTYTTRGSIDCVRLAGQAEFGVSVTDHWHVNDGDGSGSVRRKLFPDGIDNSKRVPHAGADQEEP